MKQNKIKIIKGVNKYGKDKIIEFIYNTHPDISHPDHDNGFKLSKNELNNTMNDIIDYLVKNNTQEYMITKEHNRNDKDMTLFLENSELNIDIISFASDFLNHRSIDDAMAQVSGELPELTTKYATYWYGNGEVIVSPVDDSLDEITLFVDVYGDKKYLVEG